MTEGTAHWPSPIVQHCTVEEAEYLKIRVTTNTQARLYNITGKKADTCFGQSFMMFLSFVLL